MAAPSNGHALRARARHPFGTNGCTVVRHASFHSAINLFSGRAARALLAWFRDIFRERRCLLRHLHGTACAFIAVSCAAPALALDASAPAAPAITASGLVQMPDGRLLAPEFARIVTRGTLVVAVLGVDQPPFFMSHSGALTGVDIDLADELAKKLGVSVRFDRAARYRRVHRGRQGGEDRCVGAVPVTRARDAGVAVMGCMEIPIAARALRDAPFALVDSTQELARATVTYAAERGWGRAVRRAATARCADLRHA